MKNIFLKVAIAAILCCVPFTKPMAQGVSPTASKELYNWSPFDRTKMINLFYKAEQAGRNYPTDAEMRETFGFDIEFARSHVRKRNKMVDQDKQVNPEINPNRKVWMNIPAGIGKMSGGYPSGEFINDAYSLWQYTELFGAWNHSLFQAPGAFADAAHKHGVDMFSGIEFFESWTPGSTADGYQKFITSKNSDGTFKYAKTFINILMYLGLDGINYNWEDDGFGEPDVVAFHKELFRIAEERGFDNFHIGLYTQISNLPKNYVPSMYYGHDSKKKTIDLFLNYSGGDFATYNIPNSIKNAKDATGHTNGLYQGVLIVDMDRSWTQMNEPKNREMNLVLWGEHDQSRFASYNEGTDHFDLQENYQKLLERAFSGGNRNPANLPTLSNYGNNWMKTPEGKEALSSFGGLATMIAERSTIEGKLPFYTNFQLGNGERYNFKGKKTFGNWYNMGAQDMQPTYRWLVYEAGTKTVSKDIDPKYTNRDAYTGGSTLELAGKATTKGTDIILYRTKLTVGGTNPKVAVAVKSYKKGEYPTNLSVIVKKSGSDNWIEVPYGNTSNISWEEKSLDIAGLAQNDVIEQIGLRVKAAKEVNDYQLYVGKLAFSDNSPKVKVAPIDELIVEVKEETSLSLSVKLNWKVSSLKGGENKSGLIYNDEANVDHFEIVYKNGEEGKVKEIARTSAWSNLISNIIFNDSVKVEEPFIGVRSASIDGKTYSPVKWVKVDRADPSTLPSVDVDRYCKSEINPAAAGIDIARAQRYLTEVKTIGLEKNLNFTSNTPVADGSQYLKATDYKFSAAQGQKFKFFFKALDTSNMKPRDGLRFCFAKAYIDWDNNGIFDPAKETVFDLGTAKKSTIAFETTGVEKEFTVPEKAALGEVRMRIVFSDAWFGHPGPCGSTAKGFTIDFTMEVTGNNVADVTVDKHDVGEPEEPENLNGDNTAVENVNSNMGGFSTFYPNPAVNVILLKDVQQIWVYSIDGKLLISEKDSPSQVNVSKLSSGAYIVKMLNNNVVRTEKLIKK